MIAFGPVPSRRLGRSLGINHIPLKVCTYSCIYCQVGRTDRMTVARGPHYEPEEILRDLCDKITRTSNPGETIDFLTLVPDGEPTLDINFGRVIDLIKPFGIRIAVITNASLIWREDVREELLKADWVSLKIDAVRERAWRRINRPHGTLRLDSILDGALAFARSYGGELVTETMLVKNVNDHPDHVGQIAKFLSHLRPARAYLSVPTRPPAELWVRSPDEETINQAYQILSQEVDRVETLLGYEGNAFAFTGNVQEDLLSITAVHPMREEAVSKLLSLAGSDWLVVRELIAQDQLVETEFDGHKFYMRKIH